ncbi:MAG: S41 family peptidase [Roseburia sp.]|nr:S41 family peptidase [Roseburia sp.]
MKKRKKKIIITIVSLFLVLAFWGLAICFYAPISFGGEYPPLLEPLSPGTLLTREQVQEDRDAAIQFVEDVHPYFVLEKDVSEYERARSKYMDFTSEEMSAGEFQAATAEYLCFFKDGHTRIRWSEEEFLSLNQRYQAGHTYLMIGDEVTEKYVTDIGGISIETVYQTIDGTIPAENEMAQTVNRSRYVTGKNMLELAGAKINGDSVTVTCSDGTKEEYFFEKREKVTEEDSELPLNSWKMEEDIFVVDFVECVDDDNLKSIAKNLEDAINNGCSKVLIDARGNGGGNSNACKRLLDAMGMKAPEYDMVVRYSKEAKEQAGYLRSSGIFQNKGSEKSKANENVDLVVLCDRDTFSSAAMLLVWVRDGNLGKIVGEPSSNTPSSYGDILYLSLPNSHVDASVSHKQFIRPAENNTERMLIPDVETSAEDAYEEALELLK